ncbi:MAG: CBS domain-containing protein [Halobacteriaceae archaeon]
MKVADVMTPGSAVVTVELPGTRDDALGYFKEQAFSAIPVVKEEGGTTRYRGLISRNDLIERPDEDQLALLMDADAPTVAPDDDIADVSATVLETGARRFPVLEGHELAGILTVTDVVRAIAEGQADGETPVEDLARREVNTTWTGTPLGVAERELFYADTPYAVVLDDDAEMAGVLTEVDVIAVADVVEGEEDAGESIAEQDDEWMWEGIKAVGNRYFPTRNVEFPDGPVSEFMTADVETVTGTRSAREAARVMVSEDVEQLPLVTGDRLVGVLRDVDLLRALAPAETAAAVTADGA